MVVIAQEVSSGGVVVVAAPQNREKTSLCQQCSGTGFVSLVHPFPSGLLFLPVQFRFGSVLFFRYFDSIRYDTISYDFTTRLVGGRPVCKCIGRESMAVCCRRSGGLVAHAQSPADRFLLF